MSACHDNQDSTRPGMPCSTHCLSAHSAQCCMSGHADAHRCAKVQQQVKHGQGCDRGTIAIAHPADTWVAVPAARLLAVQRTSPGHRRGFGRSCLLCSPLHTSGARPPRTRALFFRHRPWRRLARQPPRARPGRDREQASGSLSSERGALLGSQAGERARLAPRAAPRRRRRRPAAAGARRPPPGRVQGGRPGRAGRRTGRRPRRPAERAEEDAVRHRQRHRAGRLRQLARQLEHQAGRARRRRHRAGQLPQLQAAPHRPGGRARPPVRPHTLDCNMHRSSWFRSRVA